MLAINGELQWVRICCGAKSGSTLVTELQWLRTPLLPEWSGALYITGDVPVKVYFFF